MVWISQVWKTSNFDLELEVSQLSSLHPILTLNPKTMHVHDPIRAFNKHSPPFILEWNLLLIKWLQVRT